jgi:HEAT repeat protein
VRALIIDVLRALRAGDRALFATALADEDARVRAAAVHALVSLDAHEALAAALNDPDRDVRIAVAKGFGTIGDPASAESLAHLARDPDALVRAAALEAAASIATGPPLATTALEAVGDAAWQVRRGSATALGALAPGSPQDPAATEALIELLQDGHADVRKAAAVGLRSRAGQPDVDQALAKAADDSDADVRASVRLAVGSSSSGPRRASG